MAHLSRIALAAAAAVLATGIQAGTYERVSKVEIEDMFLPEPIEIDVTWVFEDTEVDGKTGVKLVSVDWEVDQIPAFILDGKKMLPVIELGEGVFADWMMASYTLPSHILKIGDGVFRDCLYLSSVNLGNTLRHIGKAPFADSMLTELAIPASVTSLDGNPASGCAFLTSIAVDAGSTAFSANDDSLFDAGRTTLLACVPAATAVTLPENLVAIADDAFAGCSHLVEVTALCEVPAADKAVFDQTPAILTVSANAWELTSWQKYIGGLWKGRVFVNSGAEDTEGDLSFTDERGITWTVSVQQGGATIVGLESDVSGAVTIPASVTLADGSVPVTALGPRALADCGGLTAVTLPETATDIASTAFVGCKALASFAVNANNPAFRARNGVLYSRDGTTLVKVPAGFRFQTTITSTATETTQNVRRSVQHYEGLTLIPETVVPYGTSTSTSSKTTYAFQPAVGVSALLDGVTSIRDYAFSDCGTLPSGSAVKGTLTVTTDGRKVSTTVGEQTMPVGTDTTNTVAVASQVTEAGFFDDTKVPQTKEIVTTASADYASNVPKPDVPDSVACSRMAWFGSVWYDQTTADAVPALGSTATAAAVSAALAGASDPLVRQNVTTASDYEAFRNWSVNVRNDEGSLVGQTGVLSALNAWQSFAIDSPVLLTRALSDSDVKITTLSAADDEGRIEIALAVNGAAVGPNATDGNLRKVFKVTGAPTVLPSDFAEKNVILVYGQPKDGKAQATLAPADTSATSFFFKAGVR